ncbi:right-handed parallel beta-helix repeat-containing protein [Pelagicoccus mobilis]|uniref:Right-handed parallel beta-helix repeat-containing protein n=1 Tax=Pelagicoccus mobilis TaxID=415221 RepID=A0A934RTG2_9BACT|nr:right-handed parallel beta-helix repeat-containing protein [Pelagicoccus mobilis]MBK1876118.1 right-handed parallel beta-helix repeat-containing protein [Pelagicoccus mobilis]
MRFFSFLFLWSSLVATLSLFGDGRVWVVAAGDPAANDEGSGTIEEPFRTISRAALLAQPGDTVRVFGGVYRERVAPARGGTAERRIVYEAAKGERVVVTGADVWRPQWRVEPGQPGLVSAILEDDRLGYFEQFSEPYLRREGRSLGQVAVRGALLDEMPSRQTMESRRGTWWIDRSEMRLYMHLPVGVDIAQDPFIELTVRDRLFAPHRRGLGYITVRGFVFDRAANQFPLRFWFPREVGNNHPQTGAIGTRSGHHWIIEHNVVRHAASIGIDIGNEGGWDTEGDQPTPEYLGRHLIQGNHIHDCGSTGIMGLGSHETRIIGNVIERINLMGNTAFEWGGIKVHDFVNGEIRGNLVRDSDCAGIWLDNGFAGARVTQNLILNNEEMGIFVELGFGPVLIDHNIVGFSRGAGIYTHDASGVTIAHNLLHANSHYGVYSHVISARKFKGADGSRRPVECSNNVVQNNLFIDNFGGTISMPPEAPRSSNNRSDYNLFLTGTRGWWENEEFLDFRLNTNSGHATAALPEGVDVLSFSLESWNESTGWDLNSRIERIKSKSPPSFLKGAGPEPAAQLAARALRFDMLEPELLGEVLGPRVEGTDYDYLGLPLDPERVSPGPWRELAVEILPLPLWPRPYTGLENDLIR